MRLRPYAITQIALMLAIVAAVAIVASPSTAESAHADEPKVVNLAAPDQVYIHCASDTAHQITMTVSQPNESLILVQCANATQNANASNGANTSGRGDDRVTTKGEPSTCEGRRHPERCK